MEWGIGQKSAKQIIGQVILVHFCHKASRKSERPTMIISFVFSLDQTRRAEDAVKGHHPLRGLDVSLHPAC